MIVIVTFCPCIAAAARINAKKNKWFLIYVIVSNDKPLPRPDMLMGNLLLLLLLPIFAYDSNAHRKEIRNDKKIIVSMTVRFGGVELFIHFLWAFLYNSLSSMESNWTMGEWKWMTKKTIGNDKQSRRRRRRRQYQQVPTGITYSSATQISVNQWHIRCCSEPVSSKAENGNRLEEYFWGRRYK